MLLKSHRLLSLTASLLFALLSIAQTPVANRVKAVVAHLPRHASVVAKYTDVYRHCLYFTMANRLYQYDVLTDRQHDVPFTGNSYARIITTWLSPDGNFFFIAVDRGNLASFYLDDGQEVWRYDSRKHKSKKIGQGFCIEVQLHDASTPMQHPSINNGWHKTTTTISTATSFGRKTSIRFP